MAGDNHDKRLKRRAETAEQLRKCPKVTGFTHGAVTRICARNFLTFTEFEMLPEPNLNLIIGPNGTGKSSLVNAIVLGLAGKTSQLGRAGNIVDFIQYGKDSAQIEIELFNQDGLNWTVRREIIKNSRTSSTTKWSLNGESVPFKTIEDLMSKLKIQVGNLCQFLPQDKVADFAKMSPVELLQNTEMAAGGDTMYKDHKELIEIRQRTRALETSIKAGQENLEEESGLNARVEEQLQQYNERQVILEQIETLKKKRAWLEYREVLIQHKANKAEMSRLTEELDNLRKSFAPQERALKAAQTKWQQAKDKLSTKLTNTKDVRGNLNLIQQKFDVLSELVEDIKSSYQAKKREEENRVKNIDAATQKIKLFEGQLIQLQREHPISPEMESNLRANLQEAIHELGLLESNRDNMQSSKAAEQRQLQSLEQEVSRLQDVGRQRENLLRQRSPQTHKALLWMRENRDKFRYNVYEPIMLNINVLNPKYARYVENHIGFKDMIAFAFENVEDRELFMKEVRDKQNLSINTVDVPRQSLDSFRPPQDISQYRKYGFQTYMRDVFDAPDGVMRYLCKMYHVHTVPIGNQDTDKLVAQITSSLPFPLFFSQNIRYYCKTSRYNTSIKSTVSSEIRGSNLLSTSADIVRINELEQLCAETRVRVTGINEQIATLDQDIRNKKLNLEELRKAQNKLREARSTMKNLEARIKTQTEARSRLQGTTIDLKREEETARAEIKKAILGKATLLQKRRAVIQASLVIHFKRILAALDQSLAEKELKAAKKGLEEAQQILKAREAELTELQRTFQEIKERGRQLLQAAKRICGLDSKEKITPELEQLFSEISDNLEEIQELMTVLEARAHFINTVDPSIIREYENRRKAIKRLEKDLGNNEGNLVELLSQVEEIKERWLPTLKELLERINQNFSNFFARLKCCGEILLNETDNPDDFDKWGIKICVKFRDNEPLKELTPAHHSGGEQSVSTGLYMLALQELTHVPFRCVDEINQGMDPKNERKVFDLITETACKKNNAQYFLLTPKLLPNLTYSENMKIFVINNGPYFHATKNWNIPRFLKMEKEMSDELQEQ